METPSSEPSNGPREARPRRALAADRPLTRRELREHRRRLAGETDADDTPTSPDARVSRTGSTAAPARDDEPEQARHDSPEDTTRQQRQDDAADKPAQEPQDEPERERRSLSEMLDSLAGPNVTLDRLTAPLAGPLEKVLPSGTEDDPKKAAEARRRRAEAERRRREQAENRRRRAEETARRRAEEHERLEAEAREREEAVLAAQHEAQQQRRRREQERLDEARAAQRERRDAEAAAEARHRTQREQARVEAERRQREAEAASAAAVAAAHEQALQDHALWLEEQERLRKAEQIAAQRREELKRRRRLEAQVQKRKNAERKRREAAEAEQAKQAERDRREREAAVAAERARVQAERRAREEAEQAERDRLRAEAEAERRRREAEAAAAAEAARLAQLERARAFARASAASALGHARRWEDRLIAAEAAEAEYIAAHLREHQERETRALRAAAERLGGSLSIPAAEDRPLLAEVNEDVSDAELQRRAVEFLPEWQRRDRLAQKARAIEAAASGPQVDPATGEIALPYVAPYAPPVYEPVSRPTGRDRLRQMFVTLSALVFVAATFWTSGLLDRVPGMAAFDSGSYLSQPSGRYRAAASVVSPLFLHALTWPVLWLLVLAYAAHQWTRRQGYALRQRRTGWLVGAALLLMSAWALLAVHSPVAVEAIPWLAATACLGVAVHRLNLSTARSRTEGLLTDGPIGALTGFALAFALTTTAASLIGLGVRVPWVAPALWGLLGLVPVLLIGGRLAWSERGRVSIAVLLGLMLLWIGLPRLLPSPLGAMQTDIVGLTAVFGAFVVFVVTCTRRYRILESERFAARHPEAVAQAAARGDVDDEAVESERDETVEAGSGRA